MTTLLDELRYLYALMRYLHARDGLDFILLVLNGLASTRIAWRLVFADIPKGEISARGSAVTRFLIAGFFGTVATRIWCGWYFTPLDPAEVGVNVMFFVFVEICRGDLRPVWEMLRQAWLARALEWALRKQTWKDRVQGGIRWLQARVHR
ncbi:hypothetical protein PQR34_46325 [Paraburkholderia sediminicola]|uniref:hypothetical protein n=1 Tax=Paraburkholderia sediminicola TaxID=458836 RepID=UPI0038BB4B29